MNIYHVMTDVNRDSLLTGLSMLGVLRGRRAGDSLSAVPALASGDWAAWLQGLSALAAAVARSDAQAEFDAMQVYLHGRTRINGIRWLLDQKQSVVVSVKTAGLTSVAALEAARFMLDFDDSFFSKGPSRGWSDCLIIDIRHWFHVHGAEFHRHLGELDASIRISRPEAG